MDDSSNNSVSSDSVVSNIALKLRRLKIEESLLSKSIRQSCDIFVEENDIMYSYSELKTLHNDLKSSYIDIRDLFEEVKANTGSKDNLKTLDISDVKKDVLNLEKKIKNFNAYLQTQLKYHKLDEQEMCRDIDSNADIVGWFGKKPKIKAKFFNEIIPSPVKQFMTSPFKCPEVQKYQNFMMSSKNRYGGWLPYNHNIFEKAWRKYFCIQKDLENYEYQEANVENSEYFEHFVADVCKNMPGITEDEIISHNKWYSKYIYLKERQQRALDKWKLNKQMIKKSRKNNNTVKGRNEDHVFKDKIKDKLNTQIKLDNNFNVLVSDEFSEMRNVFTNQLDSFSEESNSLSDSNAFLKSTTNREELKLKINDTNQSGLLNKTLTRSPLAYRKSTEQWKNRCLNNKIAQKVYPVDVQSVVKRRIPDWRLVLQTN